MTLFCLAPFILAGYAGTIQTDWHTSADISGPYAEVQTCKDGLGGRVAFGAEWVQVGPQYGYTVPLGDDWSITLQAHGGMGYSNTHHPVSGVRQITKWNGGLAVLLSVDRYSVKVGYDHSSNGRGLDPTNAGQDQWSVGVGYSF